MWKKLTSWARSGKPAAPAPHPPPGSGKTVVAVETDNGLFTADMLQQAFCGEVIGVRSFIDVTNALETGTMRRVERMLKRGDSFAGLVPRVPTVIPRLLHALKDETISAGQLARDVSQDVALVAELLRLANSPFYRTRQPVQSVEQATVLLGRDGLRNLIAKAAFRPLLDAGKEFFSGRAAPTLWAHADAASVLCECLARQQGVPVFHAFLGGLTQNIGYSVVTRILGQTYDGTEVPRSVMFRDWLVRRTPALSQAVAVEWGFPQEVTAALAEVAKAAEGASVSPLGGVVASGSTLAALHGLSQSGLVSGNVTRVVCKHNGRTGGDCEACYSRIAGVTQSP